MSAELEMRKDIEVEIKVKFNCNISDIIDAAKEVHKMEGFGNNSAIMNALPRIVGEAIKSQAPGFITETVVDTVVNKIESKVGRNQEKALNDLKKEIIAEIQKQLRDK